TSLLDAIHYLSLTKSAFGTVDAQNIQHGHRAFAVEGHFVKHDKPYTIQCRFQQPGGKQLKSNDKLYDKLRDHIGLFPVVLTTPYDWDLIRGGSEGRRKFFDSILCQLDRDYLDALVQYQSLLKQRNGLLRLHKEQGQLDRDLLASYDDQLLPLGKRLFAARTAFLETFKPNFKRYYDYFVAAEEDVQLAYVSAVSAPDFEQRFRDSLPQDLALQRTTQGVHRDDVQFLLNGHPLKRIGSQGQQKSFTIALRLAQFACMHEALQLKPLLLLDDIFDKLDEQRVAQLVQLMAAQHFGQVFITDAKGTSSATLMKQLDADQALIKMERGQQVP
ncbi:MAG: DNA replication and repair protein RecF, partial [Bacteroidota bacterium]